MVRSWFFCPFAVAAALAATAAWAQPPLTVDEVVKLVQNKISDNVIVAQIEETNSYFSLTTDDLIKLKQAGATDNLVTYMLARKPGGPPNVKGPATATTTSGGVNVNAAARAAVGAPATAEAAPEPPKKFGDVTITLNGKYVVTSGADLNVYFAAYIDGERKYYRDQWSRIITVTTAETGASAKKWILEPGTFSFKVPAGSHTLALACWSGPGVIDDAGAKAHIVFTQQLTVNEGQAVVLTLVGDTDEASGRFVVTR